MTKKQMAKELTKYLTIDPKSRYDKPVTTKFNTYDYEMLKEFSKILDEPMSKLIRDIVHYTLIEMKDFDKIN